MMDSSVLYISNKAGDLLGTGFVIDSDERGVFVATCGHVVNKHSDIFVENNAAAIILNNYENGVDLAVLYVENINRTPLTIAVKPADSSNVKVIGFTTLLNNPKREAISNIKYKKDVDIMHPKTTTTISNIKLYPNEPITEGYSGSPVICHDSGEVIAIVTVRQGKDNYAICSQHLLDMHQISQGSSRVKNKVYPKKGLITKIENDDYLIIKNKFEAELNNSLRTFSSQPTVWVEPSLNTNKEDSSRPSNKNIRVNIKDLIAEPRSLVIRARQQFGSTCLARYLVKESWVDARPSLWLYLDASSLKPYLQEIEKHVMQLVNELKLSFEDIECVVVDEFSSSLKDYDKTFTKINEYFADVPVIFMMVEAEDPLSEETISIPKNKIYQTLYLWALERNDIRQVVCGYNDKNFVGDENEVVNKVVSDLEVLNIPRTPLNCITLLKVSEYAFDDSPVNRTELIKRVLFILFNVDKIPSYKNKPDLKDTEYLLGCFCETILKEKEYYFSRKKFLDSLEIFCQRQEMDIDVDIIFDVLYENNIVIQRGSIYCFKFNYWVFYFAAQHMHTDKNFASFILQNQNYIAFPELIEFYTGIDRRREDALEIITSDIHEIYEVVKSKCALPKDFDVYSMAKWEPTEEIIEQMQTEVTEGVLNSKLPDAVKDQYADKFYDRSRPLSQDFYTILEEYSLLRLMKSVQAGAKALRNSDHAAPEIRHALLKEILMGWEKISKILVVLSPILAHQGQARIQGATFVLTDEIEGTFEEGVNDIIQLIPTNVVGWYKDDLFSKKMGPFLYSHIRVTPSKLLKHELNLLIIDKRPNGWEKIIEDYIADENKNSFFLHDVYCSLRAQYQYAFIEPKALIKIEHLIKMTAAKHQLGIKRPTKKIIAKCSDSVIPKRIES